MLGINLASKAVRTLLTTSACLLSPNRNPHLDRAQIERHLRDFLGVTNILWLGDGIVGDDTDGHIDDLTRFVAPDTVVTVVEEVLQLMEPSLRHRHIVVTRELELPPPVPMDRDRLKHEYRQADYLFLHLNGFRALESGTK